jgi:DHA1 family tetracycline resistance protein-like MFS transporter
MAQPSTHEDPLVAAVNDDNARAVALAPVYDDDAALLSADDADAGGAEVEQKCWDKFRFAVCIGGFVMLENASAVILQPEMVARKKAYFGGDQDAAMVSGIVDCVVALLNLATAPLYGRLMDRYGRRPAFVLRAALLALAAGAGALTANPIPYMALYSAAQFVQGSFVYTAVADRYPQAQRGQMFAVVLAMTPIGFIFAFGFKLFKLSDTVNFAFAAVLLLCSAAYGRFVVPETLTAAATVPFTTAGANPISGLGVLMRSRTVRIAVAMLALVGTAMSGFGDVWMFYLNEKLGFSKFDMTLLMAIAGLTAPVILLGILPVAMRRLMPAAVTSGAIIATAAFILAVAVAWHCYMVFPFVPFVTAPKAVFVVLRTVVANGGAPELLARRMTAFGAVNDLCGAAGPLFFGILLGTLPRSLISVPVYIQGVLVLLALPLARPLQRAVAADAAAAAADDECADCIPVRASPAAE